MSYAYCPSCDAKIDISGYPEIGLQVTCSSCGDLFKIVELSPLTLAWVYQNNDTDWGDEEY